MHIAPQPAELSTIVSAPPDSKAAMFVRARARAPSRSPACACSAPQQRCPAVARIVQPFRVRVRSVARFTAVKSPSITHPVSREAVPRLGTLDLSVAEVIRGAFGVARGVRPGRAVEASIAKGIANRAGSPRASPRAMPRSRTRRAAMSAGRSTHSRANPQSRSRPRIGIGR